MKKILIAFLISVALLSVCQSESISFDLEANLEFCINDIMTFNTLVVGTFETIDLEPHFEVSVSEVNVNYEGKVGDRTKGKEIFSHKVFNPKETHNNNTNDTNKSEIYSEYNERKNMIRFSFTNYDSAEYNFWVLNKDDKTHRFLFSYLVGPQAKDYSSLLQTSQVKDAENLVKLITELGDLVSRNLQDSFRYEEHKVFLSDHLSWKIVFASVLTIILIVILGIFQSYFLKSFLQDKKLI